MEKTMVNNSPYNDEKQWTTIDLTIYRSSASASAIQICIEKFK